MAKIFLDTNILIRLMEDDLSFESKEKLNKHTSCLSVLSVHIAAYVHKIRIPNDRFNNLLSHFSVLSFTSLLGKESLKGPTSDFEDNVQIQTALSSNITTFVTFDKELLKMKSYKKMKIVKPSQL